MQSLHTPRDLSVMFVDDHAVANAGLALVGLLSEKLGLEELCDERISLAPFPGRRVATLVHSLVIGGTCIDDADVLRSGSTSSVLSHRVMAPSTLGTSARQVITESAAIAMISSLMMAEIHQLREHDGGLRLSARSQAPPRRSGEYFLARRITPRAERTPVQGGSARHQPFDEESRRGSVLACPIDDPSRGPLEVAAMRIGQVGGLGDVTAL